MPLILALLACSACSSPPPPQPSPVIVTTPTTVCAGDDYKTPIMLDGTMSTSMLTLVPAEIDGGQVSFLWTLSGSPYRLVSGSLTDAKLVVTMAGDEPLQIDLKVTNGTGGSQDAVGTVSITLLEGGACPLEGDGG
jgi:hypothetical protein